MLRFSLFVQPQERHIVLTSINHPGLPPNLISMMDIDLLVIKGKNAPVQGNISDIRLVEQWLYCV